MSDELNWTNNTNLQRTYFIFICGVKANVIFTETHEHLG